MQLRLHEQRGRVVLGQLLWATWCGSPAGRRCRCSTSSTKSTRARAIFTLLGVNVDEDPAVAQAASQLGLAFPVLLDADKAVSQALRAGQHALHPAHRPRRLRALPAQHTRRAMRPYEKQIREPLKE